VTNFLALVMMLTASLSLLPPAFQPQSPIGPYTGSWKPAAIPTFVISGPSNPSPPDSASADSTKTLAPRG